MEDLMRSAIGGGLLLSLILCASQAYARDVKISGTHNVSDIEMHCIDNGGTFFNGPQGGYGCAGSGGGTVTCTAKGKCTGTVSKIAGQGGKGTGINGVIKALNTSKGATMGGSKQPMHAGTTITAPTKMNTDHSLNNNGGGMHHTRGR
jgi:hypothetical protein